MKAVIYARYSSYNQQEQSIEGQLRACSEFAKSHQLEIVDTYCDRAKSGRNSNRPEFQRMLNNAKLHVFQIVLVYQFDRFARNRQEHMNNEIYLNSHGAKLISVTENINEEDSSSVIVKGLFQAIAEYYSVDLSKKVRRGVKESIIQRKSLGGIRLLGYKTDKTTRKIYIDEEEAAIVKRIYKMRLDGATVKLIADTLNSENLLNKTVPFNRLSIRKILENRKYIGEYINPQDPTEFIFDMFPRIIDDKTFYDVKKTFDCMKTKSSARRIEQGRIYYLTGKLFSSIDGTMFSGSSGTSKTGRSYHYYKAKINGQTVSYNQENLENRLIAHLKQILSTEVFTNYIVDKMIEASSYSDEDNAKNLEIQKEIDSIQAKIIKISDAFIEANKEMRETLNEQVKRLREHQLALENSKIKRSPLPKGVNKQSLKAWFKHFLDKDLNNPDNRLDFFKLFLNSAFIYKDHVDIYINFDVADTVSFDKYKTDLSTMDKSVRIESVLAE